MACTASILFSSTKFLQLVVLEKEYRKQNWRMNIVKIVKIMDKVVENLTWGKVNPY